MTEVQNDGKIPPLTLGWRLRMAREDAGLGLREFAERIGVSTDTLTSAEKDRRKVRPITINAYAMATGVSKKWLQTGEAETVGPNPDGGGRQPDAVRKLTDTKRSRTRHAEAGSIEQYDVAGLAA